MLVKSAPDTKCPKEENPREYIIDSEAVEVTPTAYYLRLVDDGSLIVMTSDKRPVTKDLKD